MTWIHTLSKNGGEDQYLQESVTKRGSESGKARHQLYTSITIPDLNSTSHRSSAYKTRRIVETKKDKMMGTLKGFCHPLLRFFNYLNFFPDWKLYIDLFDPAPYN